LLRTEPDRAAELLDDVVDLQRRVTREMRELVDGLRPPVLDQLGLAGALRRQAALLTDQNATASLRFDVHAPEPLVLSAAAEVAAYRIAMEAMHNVVRHAAARTATVRLRWGDGALLVEVQDDGRGLPDRYRAGVGLLSMRERALEIGGSCTVGAAPGGGTRVLARLPVTAEQAPGH
jgi:signal transduction histidine kinase